METTANGDQLLDQLQITQLIQNWGNWRDTGVWDKLRDCYMPDATMVTTWYEGSASGFVDASQQGRSRQPKDRGALHLIGGTTSEVIGLRALAETRITLLLRTLVHDTLVDVTVYGRFIDCLLKSEGRWRIQSRQPVYDKDSLRAVDPDKNLTLDAKVLAKYPSGFRHLAYVQANEGSSITLSIPDPYSPEERAVYAKSQAWLQGASL